MKKTMGNLLTLSPRLEQNFYGFADKISDGTYKGGNWLDTEPEEGVIYTKLQQKEPIKACNHVAYFEKVISADAFSIVVNLYFFSALSFKTEGPPQKLACERFHKLRAWALEHHDEAGDICQLID
ncbi:antirestriction protein [Pseudoalteromonas sp.]|uniref:antirestriction protein n=1 Tax=Pseudoalteromonas sp. TaxID=53249 RepID=UPI00272AF529|nr:antirestriction protein [Pseudoalteromonas sp.]